MKFPKRNKLPKNISPKNKPFIYLIAVVLIVTIGLYLVQDHENILSKNNKKVQEISLTTLLSKYQKNELVSIEVEKQKITAIDKEKQKYKSVRDLSSSVIDLGFNDSSIETEVKIVDIESSQFWRNLMIGLAPLVIIIIIFVIISRKMNGKGGGAFSFSKSKAKMFDKKKGVITFKDVAGATEAKEEVFEIIDFLKSPKKYQKAGAKIPRGILMVGHPGTGKTLIARAIAGEAHVPFYSVSGSEFIEMFVGVGASRVRDLFETAKKTAPCIIFIDEIDAIGKQRGQGGGAGGHDEREQTLNQILTEMDGFEKNTSVIIIAATNRPDVLDKALLRPGRFDRRVVVDLPDMNARKEILQVHSQGKTLNKDVKLKRIASKTTGFSGADLESVMNEAAILSVKNKQKNITQDNLENSVEKVAIGPERRSRKFTEKERELTAIHEVGHALAGHFCATHDAVHKISIVSRGQALGLTWFLPEEDVYSKNKQKLIDEMITLQGGRVAERLIFGEKSLTTGASNDLERISQIARSMVQRFGMAENPKLGSVVFATNNSFENKPYSEEIGKVIDEEVCKFITQAEKDCTKILNKNMSLLKKIAKDLLKKENISREEFESYFPKEK
jgi:cell division protease FtsH